MRYVLILTLLAGCSTSTGPIHGDSPEMLDGTSSSSGDGSADAEPRDGRDVIMVLAGLDDEASDEAQGAAGAPAPQPEADAGLGDSEPQDPGTEPPQDPQPAPDAGADTGMDPEPDAGAMPEPLTGDARIALGACETSDDCDVGEVCENVGGHGLCTSTCSNENADCSAIGTGAFCHIGFMACVLDCDGGCPDGMVCLSNTLCGYDSSQIALPPPPAGCAIDTDCGSLGCCRPDGSCGVGSGGTCF